MRSIRTLIACALACSAFVGWGALNPAETFAENPALTVTVTHDAPGDEAEYGSAVTFSYAVRNSGDVTVTAVSVDDTWAGHLGDIGELAPGSEQVFTRAIRIEGSIGGAGATTAAGTTAGGASVRAADEYYIDVYIADRFTDFAIEKRLVGGSAVPGGVLTYRLTIRNVDGAALDPDALVIRVVDDYDESRVTLADAGGGSASLGTLVWSVAAPGPGDGPVVLEYQLRVRAAARGRVTNTARIEHPLDPVAENDSDSVGVTIAVPPSGAGSGSGDAAPDADDDASGSASRSSSATEGEPFLPFTGAPLVPTLPLAGVFLALGALLRRVAR